jgi:hypothetical protein
VQLALLALQAQLVQLETRDQQAQIQLSQVPRVLSVQQAQLVSKVLLVQRELRVLRA